MSGVVLTQRHATRQRLDMSALLPEHLAGMSQQAIAALPLRLGRHQVDLGELFDVAGTPDDELLIRPCADNLDGIGRGMRSGRIRVAGDAGHRAGAGMRGGQIEIEGRAADAAAEGMSGGTLLIGGDCGDRLGGPPPGERQGMRGGLVRVRGNAGDRAAERQRRGILLVDGDCGDYAGVNMIAGTLVVLGQSGAYCGWNMRRGTLLLTRAPRSRPGTFADNGLQRPGYLTLLLRALAASGAALPVPTDGPPRVHRLLGDLACGGQGEILILA